LEKSLVIGKSLKIKEKKYYASVQHVEQEEKYLSLIFLTAKQKAVVALKKEIF
jgi:hypothetical protein